MYKCNNTSEEWKHKERQSEGGVQGLPLANAWKGKTEGFESRPSLLSAGATCPVLAECLMDRKDMMLAWLIKQASKEDWKGLEATGLRLGLRLQRGLADLKAAWEKMQHESGRESQRRLERQLPAGLGVKPEDGGDGRGAVSTMAAMGATRSRREGGIHQDATPRDLIGGTSGEPSTRSSLQPTLANINTRITRWFLMLVLMICEGIVFRKPRADPDQHRGQKLPCAYSQEVLIAHHRRSEFQIFLMKERKQKENGQIEAAPGPGSEGSFPNQHPSRHLHVDFWSMT
ncbi:hypothetical protein DFH07DRAFT_784307 [Mycena maculata]|uniref:Uncharacterized protein n=1 Tax=Mycena maculata TaxID=230809 RepID=A0AAD7HI40_9AGAR|nr:hypothetical protein DFH07DRAFT_784307 [Mycena maculata]